MIALPRHGEKGRPSPSENQRTSPYKEPKYTVGGAITSACLVVLPVHSMGSPHQPTSGILGTSNLSRTTDNAHSVPKPVCAARRCMLSVYRITVCPIAPSRSPAGSTVDYLYYT
jgi:hypothetical protein